MANFCSNCRFPLAASASFCPQCGRQQAVAQPAPAANVPAAAGAGGGSALKILVIVFACLVGLGVAAAAVGYYAIHKVKEAVVATAESHGIDLKSIPSPIPSSSSSPHNRTYKPCEVLPKSEASTLLGEPIERTAIEQESCDYYGPPGLAAKLASQNTSDMMKRAKDGTALNGGDVADTVTKMLSAAAAQNGAGNGDHGEVPLLRFMIDPDGRPQMAAMAATKGIFGGIFAAAAADDQKAAATKGKRLDFGANVPNLGDQAIFLPPLGLNVLKGDTVMRIIVGPVPNPNDVAIAIARAALPRL